MASLHLAERQDGIFRTLKAFEAFPTWRARGSTGRQTQGPGAARGDPGGWAAPHMPAHYRALPPHYPALPCMVQHRSARVQHASFVPKICPWPLRACGPRTGSPARRGGRRESGAGRMPILSQFFIRVSECDCMPSMFGAPACASPGVSPVPCSRPSARTRRRPGVPIPGELRLG